MRVSFARDTGLLKSKILTSIGYCIPCWFLKGVSYAKPLSFPSLWFYYVKPTTNSFQKVLRRFEQAFLLFVALIFLVLLKDTTSFYFFLRIGRATTLRIPCKRNAHRIQKASIPSACLFFGFT